MRRQGREGALDQTATVSFDLFRCPVGQEGEEDRLVQLGGGKGQPAQHLVAVAAIEPGLGRQIGDIGQHRDILAQQGAVVGAQDGNLRHRVDVLEIRLARPPGLAVDCDIACVESGLVEGDAAGHRTSERLEIKIHRNVSYR
jgi:hypothetical protein